MKTESTLQESTYYHEPQFYEKIKELQAWITSRFDKSGFVNPLDVLAYDALYYIIFGMRSNGKTTAARLCARSRHIMYGEYCALIRRWDEDFSGKAAARFWYVLEKLGVIDYLTGGEWTGVYYYSKQFYLSRKGENGKTQHAP